MAFIVACLVLALLRFTIASPVSGSIASISPVIVSGTGAQSCPTVEQLKSVRQRLSDQVQLALQSPRFYSVNQCGDGVWYRLVGTNMSDPLSQCPGGWVEENTGGVRACGRGTIGASCRSALLANDGRQYTRVCGRAIGYQYGHTDAFAGNNFRSINQVYVDGLSITRGSPRQHIWTYAAAVREGPSTYTGSNCPCSSYPGASPPSYIGNNWYCESGNPNPITPSTLLSDDPLWDGEDCEGSCCSNGRSPPWFSVELPGPTNEAIEARICASEHSDTNEDVFINLFEIYIQ